MVGLLQGQSALPISVAVLVSCSMLRNEATCCCEDSPPLKEEGYL